MTVYALLVGINTYAANGVSNLNGCVNDVRRFKELLRKRVGRKNLKLDTLTDKKATYQEIINRFETHLGQAQNGDVALFYYSGHGSQETAHDAFNEPDGKNETLVCHDSRAGAYDLADKEIAYLIKKISAGKPNLHTVVILDSCHSGTATRNTDGVRQSPGSEVERPIESYHIAPKPSKSANSIVQEKANWYRPPNGKHLLIAACAPHEEAREKRLGQDGMVQGVFSYYLREAISAAGPELSYLALFRRVRAKVRYVNRYQTPQLESASENLNQPFLGGKILPQGSGFIASFNPEWDRWEIDGGLIHGIRPPADGKMTRVALYPEDAEIEPSSLIGIVAVTEVYAGTSKIEKTAVKTEDDGYKRATELRRGTNYQAVITELPNPMPPLTVALSGPEADLKQLQERLATANEGNPSLYVRFDDKNPRMTVVADPIAKIYQISRADDPNMLVVNTPYDSNGGDGAALVIRRLEQIARWHTVFDLDNQFTTIPPNNLEFKVTPSDAFKNEMMVPVLDENGFKIGEEKYEGQKELVLKQVEQDGQWKKPGIKVDLINHSEERAYHCALLLLAPDFSVWPVSTRGNLATVKVPRKENERQRHRGSSPYWAGNGSCLK